MKALFRKIILGILTWCARRRLARMRAHGVRVVGVTGSMGKTTCKEAISYVLRGSFQVMSSAKSYNTEFGLPLTILELRSEFSSVIGWARNIIVAIWRAFFASTRYDFLVLEMGVDKPRDMDVLLKVIKTVDVSVFTGVHPVHMAEGQFVSMDAIFEEKAKLVKATRPEGVVFLNEDDERCRALGRELGSRKGGAKVVMYGGGERDPAGSPGRGAKMRASQVYGGWDGLRFEANYGEVRGQFDVPVLGTQHVSSLLPAIGCALLHGMYMGDIVNRMQSFQLPPGRLTLIPGKHGAWILDSSYNASPDAVRAALVTLVELAEEKQMTRRIFVFGNMNELGSISEREHRGITSSLLGSVDVLITVGEQAKFCADEAIEKNILPRDHVYSFRTTDEIAVFFQDFLREGDLALVKGSQNNIRLERLIKAIMKDPERAQDLLARQDWNSV